MAFKADFKATFVNNFTSPERGELMDGYIFNYGLTKADGTPLTTATEKADAVVNHFANELRRYRRLALRQASINAIPEPPDITIS